MDFSFKMIKIPPYVLFMLEKLSYLDRIKLLMMVAMTIGHFAWAFVPTETTLSDLLHFFARVTIPLVCFLVVQGFYLSRDLFGYAKRLFVFAFLAQVGFTVAQTGLWAVIETPQLVITYGNVLFTLGFGLLALMAVHETKQRPIDQKLPFLLAVLFLGVVALWSDWGISVIVWILSIYGFGAMGFLWATLGLFLFAYSLPDELMVLFPNIKNPMDFGLFLSVPIMLWYEKNKQNSPKVYRLPRTFFYWYYVGHLWVIGLLLTVLG